MFASKAKGEKLKGTAPLGQEPGLAPKHNTRLEILPRANALYNKRLVDTKVSES
jgi:hypothetical protein